MAEVYKSHEAQPPAPAPAQQSYLTMEHIKHHVIELKNINFIPRYLLEYFQSPAQPFQPPQTPRAESEQSIRNVNHILDGRSMCNVSNTASKSVLDSEIGCNGNVSRPYPEPETPEVPGPGSVSRGAWTVAARTWASFSDTENNNDEAQRDVRYNRNYLYKFHNFNQNSLLYSLRGSFSSFDDSINEDKVMFGSTSAVRPLGKFNSPRFSSPPSYSHNSPVLYPLPPSLCPPFIQRKCNPSLCRPLVFK